MLALELYSKESVAVIAFFVSVLSSIITTFALGYAKRPQVVFEQKAAVIGEIARGRIEGIQKIRHALLIAEGLESVPFLETESLEELSFRSSPLIIHALLDARVTMQSMMELNSMCVEYSDMLGYKSRANMMCLCRVLNEIAQFGIKRKLDSRRYQRICAGGSKELTDLLRKCDSCLVRELNRVRTRFAKRDGLIWQACCRWEWRRYAKCIKHFDCLFERDSSDE